MPAQYGALSTIGANPAFLPPNAAGCPLIKVWDRFNFANDVPGSYRLFGKSIPRGAVPMGGGFIASISGGTTTFALGITGALGKYRAAAVFTAVDTKTEFMLAASALIELAAAHQCKPADVADAAATLAVAAAVLPCWPYSRPTDRRASQSACRYKESQFSLSTCRYNESLTCQ
jgi:hypothetical protein